MSPCLCRFQVFSITRNPSMCFFHEKGKKHGFSMLSWVQITWKRTETVLFDEVIMSSNKKTVGPLFQMRTWSPSPGGKCLLLPNPWKSGEAQCHSDEALVEANSKPKEMDLDHHDKSSFWNGFCCGKVRMNWEIWVWHIPHVVTFKCDPKIGQQWGTDCTHCQHVTRRTTGPSGPIGQFW